MPLLQRSWPSGLAHEWLSFAAENTAEAGQDDWRCQAESDPEAELWKIKNKAEYKNHLLKVRATILQRENDQDKDIISDIGVNFHDQW